MTAYVLSESELDELKAWEKQGVQPSEFLWRIICNDLIGAVAYATPAQESFLAEIVLAVNGLLPPDSWGLQLRAIAWRNKFNYAVEEDDGHAD